MPPTLTADLLAAARVIRAGRLPIAPADPLRVLLDLDTADRVRLAELLESIVATAPPAPGAPPSPYEPGGGGPHG